MFIRYEPLPVTSRLRTLPNVVLLPHTGGGSYRSRTVDLPASLQNIARFFAGEKVDGVINRKGRLNTFGSALAIITSMGAFPTASRSGPLRLTVP